MKLFSCQACGQLLYFENVRCENCGHALGYLTDINEISALEPAQPPAQGWRALAAPQKLLKFCNNYDAGMFEALPVSRGRFAPADDLDRPISGDCQWPELRGIPWFPALGDGACDNVGSGCTTREQVYEDNANRCILLYMDGSAEQDLKIMDYQRKMSAGLIDHFAEKKVREALKNVQRMLNRSQLKTLMPLICNCRRLFSSPGAPCCYCFCSPKPLPITISTSVN